jgi:hypothetical protein
MRKPRDLNAELEALAQRRKALMGRRVTQFGELVVACGADVLETDVLTGALLAAVAGSQEEKAAWRESGSAFFRKQGGKGAARRRSGAAADSRSGSQDAGSGTQA